MLRKSGVGDLKSFLVNDLSFNSSIQVAGDVGNNAHSGIIDTALLESRVEWLECGKKRPSLARHLLGTLENPT